MGVKTKVFGKYAWLFLEGMARFHDEYMATETDMKLRLDMRDFFREFFFLVGQVLPCVYCRISYREFTSPDHPANKYCNILSMLSEKDGAKKFVYHLHTRVSVKLRDQERETYADDPAKLKEINEKWFKYMISYETAIQTRFFPICSIRFWNAAIIFLALTVCDWRPDEACYIHRFFWLIGKILCRSKNREEKILANLYMQAFEKSQSVWKRDTDLDTRLDTVWIIKKYIFDAKKWKFSCNRSEFIFKCKSAIVGCNPGK